MPQTTGLNKDKAASNATKLWPPLQIRVSGHPKDAVPGLVFGQPPETRVVPGNALNPQFNGTFRLRIHCPALAVLSPGRRGWGWPMGRVLCWGGGCLRYRHWPWCRLFVYHHDPPLSDLF